jgi:hypothetical protein
VDFVAFEESISAALKQLPPPISGTVHLSLDAQSPMAVGFYEANAIFYRAFGKAAWLVSMDTEPLSTKFNKTSLLKYFDANYADYRTKYVMQEATDLCHTDIKIKIQKQRHWKIKDWLYLFGFGESPGIGTELTAFQSFCAS